MRCLVLLSAVLSAAPALGQGYYRYEAEAGTLSGISIGTSVPGYSGTGYVTGFDGDADYLQLQANVPDGMYELWVRYNSPYGHKGYGVQSDSEAGDASFDGNGNQFTLDRAGVFNLTGATNTLKILKGWGYYNVDYLELRPFTVQAPAPVAPTLIDSQANNRTHGLMNYLSSVYGSKTLAGQQGLTGQNVPFPSTPYLTSSGQVVPALRGSDFMDYSPSRIQFGANPNGESERIIAWAKQTGGVVSMSWHWNAPSGLINQPGHEWWRGFYTHATTFDVQAALANPAGSDYQLLLRDIDAIAIELEKFQTAGVPVLWRPLHEAQGAWFWWGAKGPQAFKGLWNLVYDRLTNEHDLHNLIWVYTSSPADQGFEDWYPGNNRVDIVGADVYTSASSSMSGQWYDLLEHYDGQKMITLSETGTLPIADLLRQRGIHWSWASPWGVNDVLNNYTPAQLQAFLNDPDIITLGELPLFTWNPRFGDYDDDDDVDASDIDILWRIVRGAGSDPNNDDTADLNNDGAVNEDDVNLLLASRLSLGHPTSYGDADLDGDVDGADFDRWRLRAGNGWSNGDFDGDGDVDGADFDLWRLRPTAIGPQSAQLGVPEPPAWLPALIGVAALAFRTCS